jgi:CHAD domain-containing protein
VINASSDHRRIPQASQVLSQALRRVLKERSRARKKLASEPIHDLRVALRRSRCLAEGFSEMDTHPCWRHFGKSCKQLQGKLAELLDIHVMLEWIRRLGLDKQADGTHLAGVLAGQERHARHETRAALEDFSRKRWKEWKRRLPERAEALPFRELHFASLALRRLQEVQKLERQRRRNPSGAAVHRLRVAVKRFRYTVESFLPEKHAAWRKKLRRLQRLLGEVHDLDVLRAKLPELARHRAKLPQLEEELRKQQPRALIERSREERITAYDRLVSPHSRPDGSRIPESSLWDRWKRELDDLVGINLPESEAPSKSKARRVKRSVEKAISAPGRRLRLS